MIPNQEKTVDLDMLARELSGAEFKRALTGAVKTLARSTAPVIFRGSDAFINLETGQINLPSIPDSAVIPLKFAREMRGFADHEPAHARYTSKVAINEIIEMLTGRGINPSKALSWGNAIEDVRIEKLTIEAYLGSRKNLEATTRRVVLEMLTRIADGEIEVPEFTSILPFLLCVLGRANNGYDLYDDASGLDLGAALRKVCVTNAEDSVFLDNALARVALVAALRTNLEGTRATYKLALDLLAELNLLEPVENDSDAAPDAGDADPSDSDSGENDSTDSDSSAGSSDDSSPDESDESGNGESDGEEDSDESDADSNESGEEGLGASNDSSEEVDDSDTASNANPNDDNTGTPNAEREEILDKLRSDEGGVDTCGSESVSLSDEDLDVQKLFEETLKTIFHKQEIRGSSDDVFEYMFVDDAKQVQHNVADPSQYGSTTNFERNIAYMNEQLGGRVSTMGRKLERAILGMQTRDWIDGREQGRLDPRRLVNARNGERQVYRERQDRPEIDTYISVLVDCSGSMAGSNMLTAAVTAKALGLVLERLGVRFDIKGFNTRYDETFQKSAAELSRDYAGSNVMVSYRTTEITTYKTADQRMRQTEKSLVLLAQAANNQNDDIAAIRAVRAELEQQPESRKILIVLSDGQPTPDAYCTNFVGLTTGAGYTECHATMIREIETCEARGITTVGIGIESNAVKEFYPRHVVVENLKTLSRDLFDQLGDVMLNKRAKRALKLDPVCEAS